MYDDKWADKWISRANRCFETGDYRRAAKIYSYILRRMPTNIRALVGRGDAWMEEKKYLQAYTDYEKAFNLNPEDEEIAHKRRSAFALQFSEKEDEILKKRLEEELKMVTERIEKEYSEKLEKKSRATIEQIAVDPEELREEAKRNRRQSEMFRYLAIMVVYVIPFWIFFAFTELANFTIFDTYGPLLRLPVATISSSPLVILMWLFLRWRYEAKILSYAFQRKAIVEDRINVYFHSDPEQFKRMQEIYITQWIDKSPVELMLDIGGRDKKSGGGSDIPAEDLLEKITELTKELTKVLRLGKDGN